MANAIRKIRTTQDRVGADTESGPRIDTIDQTWNHVTQHGCNVVKHLHKSSGSISMRPTAMNRLTT
jgi:hypothetical protein